MIQCVIFDFGDTLALSSKARKVINFVELGFTIFKEHGFSGTFDDYVHARKEADSIYVKSGSKRYESGYYNKLVSESAGWKIPFEKCQEMDREYHTAYISKVELDPHAIEILRYLRKNRVLCILLSNGHKRNIIPVLDRYHATELFDKLFVSHDIGKEKSELTPFKKILREFKLNPSEVIMIGDRLDEDMYAKKLGINTIRIKREIQHLVGEPLQPDFEVFSLLELKDVITKLNKMN